MEGPGGLYPPGRLPVAVALLLECHMVITATVGRSCNPIK